MHLLRVGIENLYSFKTAEFRFNEYNVVVGTNNVGKTNLVRLFQKLVSEINLNYFKINKKIKLDPNKSSQLKLSIFLNNFETKILLQALFKKDIESDSFEDSIRELTVIINWSDILNEEPLPINIIYYFKNGLTIASSFGKNVVFHSNALDEGKKSKLFSNIDKLNSSEIEDLLINKGLVPGVEIWNEDLFEDMLCGLNVSQHFFEVDHGVFTNIDLNIYHESGKPKKYSSEVIDFVKQRKDSNTSVSFDRIIGKIIEYNLVFIEEIHPSYQELTDSLHKLKNENESAYKYLQEGFAEIFNNISVRVDETKVNAVVSKRIVLTENGRDFFLEESASGHYAAIHLLHIILNRPDNVLLIDEPEVHFHPVKINQLAQKFMELSDLSSNQIIVISHSPKFVDYKLLDPKKPYSVTSIKKENSVSIVHSIPENFKLNLKRHLFNPEVFFGNCTILVEGAADEYALKALSDHYEGIFEKNSITTLTCWGVDQIYPNIEFHNQFQIPFIAMVDKEYKEDMTNVIQLQGNLETEFTKLGWKATSKHPKLSVETAYSFISDLIKTDNGLNAIKKTDLWRAFKTVVGRSGGTSLP